MQKTLLAVLAVALLAPSGLVAQDRTLEISLTPTKRTQIAIWLERPDGTFVRTLRLSEATALRGIGNRPGALQMNSGFRWPYGRREGTLPVWAHRRAAAQGYFRRVIFQDRQSEGFASRTSQDASPDNFFCLSFTNNNSREALDAVTCASQFNSDKGRFITQADVDYAEPFESETGASMEMRVLSQTSVYPPRRDLQAFGRDDHADVQQFQSHAREVMPELDAVTMATLAADTARTLQIALPTSDLPDGTYKVLVEVGVEGDYNTAWGPERFPTPRLPVGTQMRWDFWAETYGYPYRGQPSVVYEVPIEVSNAGGSFTTSSAIGYGDIHGLTGTLHPMDATISTADGSGIDRLKMDGGSRVAVRVVPTSVCVGPNPPPQCFVECSTARPCATGFICAEDGRCVGECDAASPPPAATDFAVEASATKTWEYAALHFTAPTSSRPIVNYEVRVAETPFDGSIDFGSWGVPAKAATTDDIELMIDPNTPAGSPINVELGHLAAQTHYYVGVRAVDSCGQRSTPSVDEIQTTEIIFTTVSPCFVATAAYGHPMAQEIGGLRHFRDRVLLTTSLGRWLVQVYRELGPTAADYIRESESRRSAARFMLSPIVEITSWFAE